MALAYGTRTSPTAEEAETASRLGLSIEAVRGMRAATETSKEIADFFGVDVNKADITKVGTCTIIKTGTAPNHNFVLNPARAARWDWGDGTTSNFSAAGGTHSFSPAGTYLVKADFGSGLIPTLSVTV